MKETKVQKRLSDIDRWWKREPWPSIILAIDPGHTCGATLVKSIPYKGVFLEECVTIDINTRKIEEMIDRAIKLAVDMELKLFLVLESWGSGGRLGIDQWLGLGETRGPWRREFIIRCSEVNSRFVSKNNVITVPQTKWRSRIIGSVGYRDHVTKELVRYTTDEWKLEAYKAASEFYLVSSVPNEPDASESACIAAYTVRSDLLGSKLSKRYLSRFDLTYSALGV